jgi:signal transduction histidine kinase
MRAYSLRWRLLAGAAIAIFATLTVAWFAMTWLFDLQLERQAEEELRRDALELVADLKADESGKLPMIEGPGDPRFDKPASGLYWQVTAPSGTQRSRSLWDQELPPSKAADALDWRTHFVDGPFGRKLFLLDRIVQPEGIMDKVVVQLALDEEQMDAAGFEFGQTLALFLVLIWAALSLAAWIQVELGLKPLASLKREIAALRLNPAERLSTAYPSEVEPLTRAINDLASAREADVKRARQRAADLAHGMKTPLAALAAQSRLIREGATENSRVASEGLDRAIAAAAAAVEGELARSRAAASRLNHQAAKAAPLLVAQRLISVLERTDKGMRVDYIVEIPETLRLAISDEDLTEILGPLLENAVRFSRRQVRVASQSNAGKNLLSVEDDGPGIKMSEAAEMMVRGARVDQAGGGHGLGLAIARELVEATGGTITLGESSLGGLRVDLSW